MRPKLIEDWHKAWKWLSVQAMLANAAFLATWPTIPADVKTALPQWFMTAVSIGLLLLGIVGRVVQQKD